MKKHHSVQHQGIRGKRGRNTQNQRRGLWTDVACQRLFVNGPGTYHFEGFEPTPRSSASLYIRPLSTRVSMAAEGKSYRKSYSNGLRPGPTC